MTEPEHVRLDLQVEMREYPPQDYLGVEFEAAPATVGDSVSAAYSRVFALLARERLQPAGHPFLIASQPTPELLRILVGVPTREALNGSGDIRPGQLPGGRAAVCLHRGPYEGLSPVYEALRAWLAAHSLVPAGPPREVFLNGPGEAASPDDYLTELVWPIA